MQRKPARLASQDLTILALDISLSATGWAIVKVTGGLTTLVCCNEIKTNAKQTHGQRLRVIRKTLETIHKSNPFDILVREKGFSRFPRETQALFKVHGVAEEYFTDFKVQEYAPATIKKVIAGTGKASKDEVEAGVRRILDLPEEFIFVSDNASDAVAVALTYIIEKGGIK